MDIVDIESQLQELVRSDQKSWVKIYELMQTVEDDKLYENDYKSYTAWVNSFAERTGCHVSLLWNRKKAGKFYVEYFERRTTKETSEKTNIVPLKDITVSPDTIILVEKVAGDNHEVADELLGKVLKGELGRKELSSAWRTVKAERAERGEKVYRKNAYDKLSPNSETVKQAEKDKSLTAVDVVLAFKNSNWLKRVYKEYCSEKYRLMTEFAVDSGVTKHSRRIDILVLETLSTVERNDLALHGIEIKVSKHDLLSDKKMAEYTYFCDYFWLAVPENLVECALSVVSESWGVISVSKEHSLEIIKPSTRCDAVFRDKTINYALLKLL
ncbi:MAG: MmcB family DNA repair protein [Ruminococcus sp.]|nr:MmcB family DNA repair protein [Ruminococcus sp.]